MLETMEIFEPNGIKLRVVKFQGNYSVTAYLGVRAINNSKIYTLDDLFDFRVAIRGGYEVTVSDAIIMADLTNKKTIVKGSVVITPIKPLSVRPIDSLREFSKFEVYIPFDARDESCKDVYLKEVPVFYDTPKSRWKTLALWFCNAVVFTGLGYWWAWSIFK